MKVEGMREGEGKRERERKRERKCVCVGVCAHVRLHDSNCVHKTGAKSEIWQHTRAHTHTHPCRPLPKGPI